MWYFRETTITYGSTWLVFNFLYLKMKRIKSWKNKWKYLLDDWSVVSQKTIHQRASWFDKKIQLKSKDPRQYKK